MSQAKNFVKRQKSYYHNEGCGCCHNSTYTKIDEKLNVISVYSGEHQGSGFCQVQVLGRIKKLGKS
jgi:hypothetical protein